LARHESVGRKKRQIDGVNGTVLAKIS
jgi:hypothetical protein